MSPSRRGPWVLTAFLAAAVGCSASPRRVTASVDEKPVVLVLRSDENPLHDWPIAALQARLTEVSVLRVAQLGADENALELAGGRPSLVVALGRKAVQLARRRMSSVPLLFAMTVGYQRLSELEGADVMGVPLELPPQAEFSQFKLALPSLRRVVTFYSPAESYELVTRAREELRGLELELVAVPIASARDVPDAYGRAVGRGDAIWMMNDPLVMNEKVFTFLKSRTRADKVPLLCSLSGAFARDGALMAVSVDLRALGRQVAAMAREFVTGTKAQAEIGVQPPIGGTLVVNLDVARAIGAPIPDEVLPFINELILSDGS